MATKTEANDFSLSENLLSRIPQYAELEKRKSRTNIPCLPYKSEYIERQSSFEKVTWLAVWVSPEFQYDLPFLQNSLVLNTSAIATLPDGYLVRKPQRWDCVISKDKEFVKAILTESYRLPASEEVLKEILEKS